MRKKSDLSLSSSFIILLDADNAFDDHDVVGDRSG